MVAMAVVVGRTVAVEDMVAAGAEKEIEEAASTRVAVAAGNLEEAVEVVDVDLICLG